jgi:imidazolonepropionase-like amidohydrolase
MKVFRAALLLVVIAAAVAPVRAQNVAVRGGIVHTLAGAPIRDGVVVVRDGKIAAIGPASSHAFQKASRPEAAVVTPGLIDAHTVVGLAGQYNVDHDQDQPRSRRSDAAGIARHRRIQSARTFGGMGVAGLGVTTIHTGHGPGAVISGQTMVAKTWARDADAAVVVPEAMLAVTLGDGTLDNKGKWPGTRGKAVAMLRAKLIEAQQYARKSGAKDESTRPGRDLKLEVLGRVLDRKLPLLVTVHRHQDILAALRVAKEFNVRIVLDGASDAPVVLDAICRGRALVVVHATMVRAGAPGNSETENVSFSTAAKLRAAGIPIAFQSGFESYVPKTRVVLFEAGAATAHGLSFDDALAAITIDSARILGVADRVGSLERGKDGDLALYDGNPFEYTSHCTGVVINGQVASDQPH